MSDIFDLDEMYEEALEEEFEDDFGDLDESYESDDDLGNMMLEDINSNNMDLHYHQNLNVPESIKPGKISPYGGFHNPAMTQKTEIAEDQYNYIIGKLHKSMHEATDLMGMLAQVRPAQEVDYSESADDDSLDNFDLDYGITESTDVVGEMDI